MEHALRLPQGDSVRWKQVREIQGVDHSISFDEFLDEPLIFNLTGMAGETVGGTVKTCHASRWNVAPHEGAGTAGNLPVVEVKPNTPLTRVIRIPKGTIKWAFSRACLPRLVGGKL